MIFLFIESSLFPQTLNTKSNKYKHMKQIINDKNLIAYCGLYCGSCKRYLKESCPGCQKNDKATWCKIRKCCIDNGYLSCADCQEFKHANDCNKFNNFLSKFFSFIMNSDRQACVDRIKDVTPEGYAKEMADKKLPSIKQR